MKLHGKNIIAGNPTAKGEKTFSALNPANGELLETSFLNPTDEEIGLAFEEAEAAFNLYRQLSRDKRAAFLDAIADESWD